MPIATCKDGEKLQGSVNYGVHKSTRQYFGHLGLVAGQPCCAYPPASSPPCLRRVGRVVVGPGVAAEAGDPGVQPARVVGIEARADVHKGGANQVDQLQAGLCGRKGSLIMLGLPALMSEEATGSADAEQAAAAALQTINSSQGQKLHSRPTTRKLANLMHYHSK